MLIFTTAADHILRLVRDLLLSGLLRLFFFGLLWQLFTYVFTEADYEAVTTVGPSHQLALEIQNREWVQSGLVIADAELSVRVLAPAPGQTLIIDRHSEVVP